VSPKRTSALEQLRLENEQLIDSRRQADEMRDQYMDLFDAGPLACLTLDGAGVIRDLNQAAAELLAQGPHQKHVTGTRLARFVREGDRKTLGAHLSMSAARPEAFACELQLLVDAVPVQLWTRRIKPGVRLYACAIVELRTRQGFEAETRRLTEAAEEAQAASRAKDQFIASLSHELRTPLTPVLAAVSALHGRSDVPPHLRDICEMIRRNIQIETRLIDDLLDVSRITQGKMRLDRQSTDVHATVGEVIETLDTEIQAKHLSVGLFLEAVRHVASADAVKMKQVLWNLVRNAVKFTPDGGRIEIRSWNDRDAPKCRLHVEVSDNGLGFNPDLGARLFEAFEQGPQAAERNGGLGLGLAICKGILELHGGTISATSRGSGLGARFVIEIDTVEALPTRAPARMAPRPGPDEPRPRILLVEDDEDTAEVLEELLQEAGYDVRSARSAKAALAFDIDTIDLLISDIGLPDISGLELMRTMKISRPVRGVALSGYGTEADVQASREAGFSAHLTKPVEFDRLLETIYRVSASGSL
jgi:signal transduction histidine kinase